jgi:hypothetical protein
MEFLDLNADPAEKPTEKLTETPMGNVKVETKVTFEKVEVKPATTETSGLSLQEAFKKLSVEDEKQQQQQQPTTEIKKVTIEVKTEKMPEGGWNDDSHVTTKPALEIDTEGKKMIPGKLTKQASFSDTELSDSEDVTQHNSHFFSSSDSIFANSPTIMICSNTERPLQVGRGAGAGCL